MKSFDLGVFKTAKKDSLEAVILSMAIALNDSKDLLWMSSMLNDHKPKNPDSISEEAGQWRAMNHFISKSILSYLHETIELIHKNKKVILSKGFEQLESSLKGVELTFWIALKEVALDRKYKVSDLGKKLVMIRNKVGFHYDANSNLQRLKETSEIYHGLGCIGPSMESTRFYFADLTYESYKKSFDMTDAEINSLFKEVNAPIRFLVCNFISGYLME